MLSLAGENLLTCCQGSRWQFDENMVFSFQDRILIGNFHINPKNMNLKKNLSRNFHALGGLQSLGCHTGESVLNVNTRGGRYAVTPDWDEQSSMKPTVIAATAQSPCDSQQKAL
jgi:hypothetical protein